MNIRRGYIEDVLSSRADSIQYINIKGSYIEGVLSFRADSIYTSISNVVI